MSSIASTLAGSTIAPISGGWPGEETGTAWWRRAGARPAALRAAGGPGGADGGRRDELRGVGVDAVEREVDVVEPEALGDRPAELFLGERPVLDEDALGGGAVLGPALDREVHRPAVDEPEVDDHVREHATGAAAPGGRGDAVAASGPGPGVEGRAHHRATSATASRIA